MDTSPDNIEAHELSSDEAEPVMSDKPTRKRRFRFSLKTMLIVFVLLCVVLGFGGKIRQATRQRQAVEAIREMGGTVYYDYEKDRRASNIELQWPAPAWLKRLIGEDFFADAVEVDCCYVSGIDDAVMEHVSCLTRLERLDLSYTMVTDAGLEHLEGLANLYDLDLGCTQVSDAGLKHHKELDLEMVDVGTANVTEEGERELREALAR